MVWLRMILLLLPGVLIGMGVFTFGYARGHSYFVDDSRACANCHVMGGHFSAWLKSSHGSVAACNDCHTPPGLVGKYINKAQNGLMHSWAFTTGLYPDTIRITSANREITVGACVGCHGNIFSQHLSVGDVISEQSCLHCHQGMGHSEGKASL